jgi:hypothetical protein
MTTAAAAQTTKPASLGAAASPQNATPAPKRTFSFATSLSIPVPVDLPKRAPGQADLPFKGWFSESLEAARDGMQPHIFIPDAYWVEEREAKAADVNQSYGRSKVMDQFRKWKFVHKDGKNTQEIVKGHEGVQCTCLWRDGKQEGFPEAGLSVWLLKSA